jgi:uncharacterized protein YneF (UPF0154 family)
MPFLAGLVPLLTLGSAGLGIGEGIASLVGGNNNPPTPNPTQTTPQMAQPPSQSQLNQIHAALASQAPNVISQTSGLANPEYLNQMIQLLAQTANTPGSQGQANSVVNSIYGSGGGSTGGPAPTPNQPFQVAGTGGGGQGPTTPGSGAGLSDFVNQFMFGGNNA